MGRKIGRVALTENDVLYLSEDPDPKDVERAEKEAAKDQAKFEKRQEDLFTTFGWKH